MNKSFIQKLEEEKEKLLNELHDLVKVNVPYNNPYYQHVIQRLGLLDEMIASYYNQRRKRN